VHGHNWAHKVGGNGPNGFKLASPAKGYKPPKGNRIEATPIPSASISASSVGLPPRKNVIQIDIPSSTSKFTSYSYNANLKPKDFHNDVKLHGIDPKPLMTHGRFLQMNKRKGKKSKLQKIAEDAIKQAKKVEKKAAELGKKVTAEPNKMVVNLHFTNKKLKAKKTAKKN